jgi:hypothetical protein
MELIAPAFHDPMLGLEVAVDAARLIIAEPDGGSGMMRTSLPDACAYLALPVVVEVLELTRGDHLGGLHQIWHRLDEHVRTDALAVLIAVAGHATRHPERN